MVNFSRIGWMIPALLGLALPGLKAESGPIRSGVAEPPKRPAEEDKTPNPEDASPQKDWMEGYYLDPQPNRLPEEVKDWSEQGLLQREGTRDVLIGFLSQVLRQNRPKIKEWDNQLAGLPPDDRRIWRTGVWYSRTTEGDEIIKEALGGKLTNEDLAPKLLELPLDRPTTLDMLWGYFFATGSESPVRRLVEAFRFEDVSEPPPGAKIPQGYVPLFTQLPEMVAWSITSMAAEHPKVAEFCVHFYESPKESQLSETESRWLRNKVLPTIDPKKFPAPNESESPKEEPVEKAGAAVPKPVTEPAVP